MVGDGEHTVMFRKKPDDEAQAEEIISKVCQALEEKGYNPIDQLVGYLLSGDPVYITNHLNARSLIRKLERDELLEQLVRSYLDRI